MLNSLNMISNTKKRNLRVKETSLQNKVHSQQKSKTWTEEGRALKQPEGESAEKSVTCIEGSRRGISLFM